VAVFALRAESRLEHGLDPLDVDEVEAERPPAGMRSCVFTHSPWAKIRTSFESPRTHTFLPTWRVGTE
jgi:hypothetical protein